MTAYYNEIDPYCVAWLRNLLAEGLIPHGVVDDRSIRDVDARDLDGFTQCHFFAGLGGWGYALRLAEWGDDRPVWTGSCPCQPFSDAGKRKGFEDERHLWPEWFRLIRECRPSVLFGEQVARAIGKGWLDTVADDLEGQGYAIGSAVLPACAVSAPHERERLWFVANASSTELRQQSGWGGGPGGQGSLFAGEYGKAQPLANANGNSEQRQTGARSVGRLRRTGEAERNGAGVRFEWPAEPDLPRVAHGVSGRVAKLRALGNAIVPQVAAEFIRAAA